MQFDDVKHIIEALIFASDQPLTAKKIKSFLPEIELSDVERAVYELNREYEERGSAFRIIEVAEGYQFATLPKFSKWVSKLFVERSRRRLSQAALETLAIIAYKQPVSKPEIESIRGVNVDHIIKSLLEKNLITIVGRGEGPGRPILYGTTKEFLKYFGLKSLSDLPKLKEIEEILKEDEEAKIYKESGSTE